MFLWMIVFIWILVKLDAPVWIFAVMFVGYIARAIMKHIIIEEVSE